MKRPVILLTLMLVLALLARVGLGSLTAAKVAALIAGCMAILGVHRFARGRADRIGDYRKPGSLDHLAVAPDGTLWGVFRFLDVDSGDIDMEIDIDLARKPDWFLRLSPLGKTPVLVCSILPQARLATTLGAAGYLRKPVSRQALLDALAQYAGG